MLLKRLLIRIIKILIRIIDKPVSLFIGVAYVGAVLFVASCNPVIGPFAVYPFYYYYLLFYIAPYIWFCAVKETLWLTFLFILYCAVFLGLYLYLRAHFPDGPSRIVSWFYSFAVGTAILICFVWDLRLIFPEETIVSLLLGAIAVFSTLSSALEHIKNFIVACINAILEAMYLWLKSCNVETVMFFWNFAFTVVGVLLATALLTLLERKIMASIQRRRGPNVIGFFGLLQPFADGLKLALKETIVPKLAVKPLFILGPIISFGLAIFGWALLPFPTWFDFDQEDFVSGSSSPVTRLIPGSAAIDFDVGLLFIFVIVALHVYGVLLGGWGSNSRYALLGALRATAQSISYELVMGFVLIILALHHGGFSLVVIVFDQADVWNIFALFPVFIIFYICSLAELNRTPFDLVEAEGELVAGYNVEYSAMLFALYFLGEYISIIFSGFVIAVLFLGAWFIPGIFYFFLKPLVCCFLSTIDAEFCLFVLSAFFFVIKATLVIISGLLVRFVLPRYRYDQLMALGWTVFLPILLFFLIFYAIIILYLF